MGQGSAVKARRGATATGRAGRTKGAVAVAGVLLALCLAPGTAGAANAFPQKQHNPRGKFLGVVPAAEANGPQRLSGQGSPPLRYHNGPVQHSSRVYSIFWNPPGYSFPSGYAADVNDYFDDVAADSFKTTNIYASNTQYYDIVNGRKRFISYDVTNGGAINDTAALPPSGCPNYRFQSGAFTAACLTDAQQIDEISRVIASRHLPRGLGVEYFLFMPERLGSCFDSAGLKHGCYDRSYCAYHSQIGSGSTVALYSSMPFAETLGCDPGSTPHDSAAEAVLNVTSHEHAETITDPTGGGWYDSSGYENGDECSFDFGPTQFNGFGYYNQVIDGEEYLLQQEWSNRGNRCVQQNTYPQPTASFSFSPSHPSPGQQVSFHSTASDSVGSSFTYVWRFGDGGASTAANPTHAFATAGTKRVTLTVFGPRGDQVRVIRSIVVS
jgi:hypothetical protein